MHKSKFTVIIPVYNGTKFLCNAVESVWRQSKTPAEVIIVDDCSTDGSRELIQKLASDSPVPMRLIKLPKNSGGPARPINLGICEAKTDYLAVLDQDDLFHPERLQLHELALSRAPDATVVFGLVASTNNPDAVLQPESSRKQLIEQSTPISAELSQLFTIPPRRATELLLTQGNFTYGFPGFSFRRSTLTKRAVNENLCICGDLDLLFYLASQGSFVFQNSIAYSRREHAENMTCNQLVTNTEMLLLKVDYLLANRWVDNAIRIKIQEQLEGMAYWAREAGHPLKSMQLYAALGRVSQWNYRVCKGILSALPVYMYRKLTFHRHREVAMTSTNRKLTVESAK